MSADSANDYLFTSTNHVDNDDEFRIGKDVPASFTSNTEQFADRQQIKEFCEKFAKMQMELKEAKHLQTIAKLEFENKALQQKLKQQEIMTEINALQAKVVKLEKEQQKEKEGKYVTAEQFNTILERISELEKQQKNEEKQQRTSKMAAENANAIVEKCDAEIEKKQQQKVTELEEHLKKLYNFIGILKDRFGNELLNTVHQKVRQEIAEKFSIPNQNYWDANVCHLNLQIIGNKSLTVHHMGNISGFWCSVFSKHSILLNMDSSNIFYYEISVKNMKSLIIFGFAVKQQTKLKGRIRNSKYAYESNGEIWINGEGKGTNAKYSYGVGDTVGIGANTATRQIIFTKNGLRLDFSDFFVSPSFADDSFHPFVSLLFTGDKIEANFGPIFKFDLATL
ncbi:hypothetical protein niasHT_025136 [Heterodera trifolii]|uniref:B30.2/SPRY domain-containing protein n=1 Tax=Heterodera trifolii TaxID=157864 RepID=A0ABD2K1I0_9BILA